MNKKLFLIFGLILMFSLGSVAQNPSAPDPEQVPLRVKPVNPINTKPINRSPVMAPTLCIEDHTLYFITPCDGCLLQLLNEDGDVEFAIEIPEESETLTLPFYLEGEYELQIVRGQYCFYGYIEL
jgi:hypothetical protein